MTTLLYYEVFVLIQIYITIFQLVVIRACTMVVIHCII